MSATNRGLIPTAPGRRGLLFGLVKGAALVMVLPSSNAIASRP